MGTGSNLNNIDLLKELFLMVYSLCFKQCFFLLFKYHIYIYFFKYLTIFSLCSIIIYSFFFKNVSIFIFIMHFKNTFSNEIMAVLCRCRWNQDRYHLPAEVMSGRSVILSTLFLGKPPRGRLPVLSAHHFTMKALKRFLPSIKCIKYKFKHENMKSR